MNDMLHTPGNKSVAVITPTTGNKYLYEAIKSVAEQDCQSVTHYVVIDGEEYQSKVWQIIEMADIPNVKVISLPDNTGKNGYNGHRIFAAFSFLVNEDFVMFLDEDNIFKPNHISSLINLIITKKLDWAYSLRSIYNEDGSFMADDNCESLGYWPSFSGRPNLVDTNCYAIRKHILTKAGHSWYYPLGADRIFYNSLIAVSKNYRCSSLYTVNYRLHSDRRSFADFFKKGNKTMTALYGEPLPWQKTDSDSYEVLEEVLGGWSIENAVVMAFIDRLEPQTTILEFGSGNGTSELLKYFNVVSIEHNPEYLIKRSEAHIIYLAKLQQGWYDCGVVKEVLSKHAAQCILIDGPPNKDRVNILHNLDLFFDFKGDIIFDDLDRDEDYATCIEFCNSLKYNFEILKGESKSFGWCKKILCNV